MAQLRRVDCPEAGGAAVILLAVDPGPETCGVVFYNSATSRVLSATNEMPVEAVLGMISGWAETPKEFEMIDVVAIERVQSYGISGASLLRTSEVVGRIWQAAALADVPVALYYRRQVLRALDVSGPGNRDALVRQRIIETFGGDRRVAVGRKVSPGPCYGVSGHAWQALGVALTHALVAG